MMQKLYSFITIGLLMVSIHSKALAQAGVGAMYIGDYSKMSSKKLMDRDIENGNWAYRMQNLKNGKYYFTVTMKDNSTREVHSKLYADSLANKSYIIDTETQQKVYCDQTRSITRNANGVAVTGMATDSCWLFKIASGKINAYSFVSEPAGPFSIVALQTGNGPIRNFDTAILEPIIDSDPKAMKAFAKKEYLKAIEKFNSNK